ncbi:MAG: undecaprenyl-phosphate glucose phosphotransferase [Gemmataceae bacterium]|nr:undecaprenyl-phosphate glucose phosphotransferase [Gemmataceae bacterium]MDW8267357.1 undecaprenyl-phosphate glucose phosphotransferase [Gemmataceae bacterium]
MIKRRSQILILWFLLWDLVLTAAAWVGAYHLRFHSGWFPVHKEQPESFLCWRHVPLVLVLSAVAYHITGQYTIHRLRRFREEVVAVVKGTLLLSLLVMATIFFLHDPYESRATMLLFTGLTATALLVARRCSWAAIRRLRANGFNQARAIIVGTGRVARKTARALRHASWMGIKNLGFIEDHPNRWCSDLDILGTINDLPQLIEKYKVAHVFISLPLNRFHEVRRVYDVLSRSLVEVHLIADVPNLAGLSLTTSNLDGLPVIGLRESPHFGLNIVIKRFMDIVLSLIALILLSPVMLVVAILIKILTPGPIFYRQERCGLNGRTFQMLKFRTMRVDAEKETGPVWARENDPRRTRLGAFLRSTSLDELPQLINVLKGDMSLVGPRPERPVFIQKFAQTIPNYMVRHCVKAGITGWAQVHGWRGNTSLRKRLEYDLYYITHWTPMLDLRILWMTLFRGFRHRNAY